jgi:thioredoxin-related protein
VVLDKQMNVINVLPGYFPPKDFVMVLWYFVNDNYKKYPFEDFRDVFESQLRPKMNKLLGYR